MALYYETNTASSEQDLLTKLFTFITAHGWTQDEFDAAGKKCAAHVDSLYVSFKWDTTNHAIGLYQSLGFTGGGGTQPGNHPNDSGSGVVSGTVTSGRRLTGIGAGPYTAYHFFLSDSAPKYCYVVLEFSSGLYRHFAMGNLSKIGTWTGGEFLTHLMWATSSMDLITNGNSYVLFDLVGVSVVTIDLGTLHIEGFPTQAGATKWGTFIAASAASRGNDRGGNARSDIAGCLRGGPLHNVFCGIPANSSNGFVPMMPIMQYFRDRVASPENWYPIGSVPNMRFINIRNLDPGEEFTVGSDTWKVFPWVRKANVGSNNQESKYQGLAYRKA